MMPDRIAVVPGLSSVALGLSPAVLCMSAAQLGASCAVPMRVMPSPVLQVEPSAPISDL